MTHAPVHILLEDSYYDTLELKPFPPSDCYFVCVVVVVFVVDVGFLGGEGGETVSYNAYEM